MPRDEKLSTGLYTFMYYANSVIGGLDLTETEKAYDQGIIEGELKGKLEGSVKGILAVLEVRFGTVPATTQKKIRDQKDLVVLDSLLSTAKTCSSLKDFNRDLD